MSNSSVETVVAPVADEPTVRGVTRLLQEVWPLAEYHEDRCVEGRLEDWRLHPRIAGHEKRSYVIRDTGRIVAHAGTFAREIATPAGSEVIFALAAVCVAPEYRGRGFGEAVVRAALRRVDEGEFRIGLWQTSDAVQPFYERLGAVRIDNRFVNSLHETDPRANPWWDPVIMRYPAAAEWTDGEVDLRGPGY